LISEVLRRELPTYPAVIQRSQLLSVSVLVVFETVGSVLVVLGAGGGEESFWGDEVGNREFVVE